MGDDGAGPDTGPRGAIELRGLTKRYGAEAVVSRVAVRIAPGEFFSLLGPSGSGKTTTLMIVAGFVAADEGAVLLDGADLQGVPPQRRGFGMVFQNYAIFPHLDVFENIAFPLRARRLPRDAIARRVDWALELVRLGGFRHRFSRELSGGQQQRVALARAIVFHPSVVLMDEPLGALDKNLRFEMQVEIKEIQQRLGMTVLYVTHDQEEAMNMSDRIAIMRGGRIEQSGAPLEVYERPANAFVGRFLGEANLLDGDVVAIADGCARLNGPAGAEWRAPARDGLRPGDRGSLFIRPERVEIAPLDAGEPVTEGAVNRIAGTIHRCAFLGNILRYIVTIGDGRTVTVDRQNGSGVCVLPPGAPVSLRWPVADGVVLAAET
jgi:ABC-type Fe3+/spermidine/putrescine transport system ATPase subunit